MFLIWHFIRGYCIFLSHFVLVSGFVKQIQFFHCLGSFSIYSDILKRVLVPTSISLPHSFALGNYLFHVVFVKM
jgi:hypothetical protein